MPPDLTNPAVLPFTFLAILTVVMFALNRKNLSASHFFLAAGLGGMSLLMARNIPLFALACAPILSELFTASLVGRRIWQDLEVRFEPFGNSSHWTLIPLIVVLCAAGFLANGNFREPRAVFQFNQRVFPVHALDWLEGNPQPGNMFNEFNWGGYILYRSWPQQRVFLDSQSDFYGEPLMREYDRVVTLGIGWEEVLETYDVKWIIFRRKPP
jgi:hypothetical protein